MAAQRARARRPGLRNQRVRALVAPVAAALAALVAPQAAALDLPWPGLPPLTGPLDPVGLVAIGAVAFALAAALIALRLRRRIDAMSLAEAERLARRDALIARFAAALETLPGGRALFPADDGPPFLFADCDTLLRAARGGPKGAALDTALARLRAEGEPFDLIAETDAGARLRVTGRPAGADGLIHVETLNDTAADTGEGTAAAERDLYRAMLEHAPFAVWLRGSDGRLLHANRAFAALTGHRDSAAALDGDAALGPEERRLAADAIASREPQRERLRLEGQAGARTLLVHARPAGTGAALAALDVTAFEEAELRLKRERETHRATLDRLSTGVAIFGPDQGLRWANRAFSELFDLEPGFVAPGMAHGALLDALRDRGRLPEEQDYPAWKRAQLGAYGGAPAGEAVWHRIDGSALRVIVQAAPGGGLVTLYEDASNELRLEGSVRTLSKVQKATLDSLREGVAVLGLDGRLKLWNAAFAALWGFDPGAGGEGPGFATLEAHLGARFLDPRAFEDHIEAIHAVELERAPREDEIVIAHDTRVLSAIVPLPDGATLLSYVDVTDRYRALEAAQEKAAALEEADRLKTDFIGHVSYNLRTPLTNIMGFAGQLANPIFGELNARQREYVGYVLRSSEQLKALIDDILDLAMIEAGTMELELSQFDLFKALDALQGLIGERVRAAGQSFRFTCDPAIGALNADERRVKQVVFNLLSNAIRFSGPGGSVELGAEGGPHSVRIWVSDTGPGIASELKPAAFERFTARGGGDARGGAGLGLALVNRFVDLHGGWVALSTHEGEGTTVVCHLPRNARRAVQPDRRIS